MMNEQKYVELLNKGIEYKHLGKYEQAKEKYIEAINLESKDPRAYYNLGKILYILEDYDASVRSYEVAFELGVDPYNVLIHLGHALLDPSDESDQWEDAILTYRKGVDPSYLAKYVGDTKKLMEAMFNNPSQSELAEYESRCIEAAKEYLKI